MRGLMIVLAFVIGIGTYGASLAVDEPDSAAAASCWATSYTWRTGSTVQAGGSFGCGQSGYYKVTTCVYSTAGYLIACGSNEGSGQSVYAGVGANCWLTSSNRGFYSVTRGTWGWAGSASRQSSTVYLPLVC